MAEPRTMGDLTIAELIDTADSEAKGLQDHIEKGLSVELSADDKIWISAFITSVRVRLAVAGMKVRDLNE